MSGDLSVAFYKTIKHHSSCLVCHSKKNLTFHHVKPEQKVNELHKVARNYPFRSLVEEFNKCVPLCWGHHLEVHKGTRQGWMSGHFDNGKPSHAAVASRFMPYLNYLAARSPDIFMGFYNDHVREAKDALSDILVPHIPVKSQQLPLFPADYIDAHQMQPRGVLYGMKGERLNCG